MIGPPAVINAWAALNNIWVWKLGISQNGNLNGQCEPYLWTKPYLRIGTKTWEHHQLHVCVRERERNVPLLSAYLTHSRREIWQASVRGLQPRGVSCGVHLKQPLNVWSEECIRDSTSNWWRNVILDYFRLFKMIEWGFNDKTKQKHHWDIIQIIGDRSTLHSLGIAPRLECQLFDTPSSPHLTAPGSEGMLQNNIGWFRIWCRMVRVCMHIYIIYIYILYIY